MAEPIRTDHTTGRPIVRKYFGFFPMKMTPTAYTRSSLAVGNVLQYQKLLPSSNQLIYSDSDLDALQKGRLLSPIGFKPNTRLVQLALNPALPGCPDRQLETFCTTLRWGFFMLKDPSAIGQIYVDRRLGRRAPSTDAAKDLVSAAMAALQVAEPRVGLQDGKAFQAGGGGAGGGGGGGARAAPLTKQAQMMQVDLPWGDLEDLLPEKEDATAAEAEWRQLLCIVTIMNNRTVLRMQTVTEMLAEELRDNPEAIGLAALAQAELYCRSHYKFKKNLDSCAVKASEWTWKPGQGPDAWSAVSAEAPAAAAVAPATAAEMQAAKAAAAARRVAPSKVVVGYELTLESKTP